MDVSLQNGSVTGKQRPMPSAASPQGRLTEANGIEAPDWRDPKRHLWLLGTIVPGLVGLSWLGVHLTGEAAFWWCGAVITFVVVPVNGPPGRRRCGRPLRRMPWPGSKTTPSIVGRPTLYLPCQYLSLVFACWLWAGGGWLTMGFWDKLGLMFTVGFVGGCAINVAHQLGHTRARSETRLAKVALAAELLRTLLRGAQPRSPCPSRHPGRPSQLPTRGESLRVHSEVSSGRRRLGMAHRGQAAGTSRPIPVDATK